MKGGNSRKEDLLFYALSGLAVGLLCALRVF